MNILLIDDDVEVRQALGHVLTVENYCVVPAANQREALREFGTRPIDIVLLDLNPRNEDGFETVRSLTDLQPQIPVVAMTTRAEQQFSSADVVDALVEKPLKLSGLIQILKELCSQPPELRPRCSAGQHRATQKQSPLRNHFNKFINMLKNSYQFITNRSARFAAPPEASIRILLLLGILNLLFAVPLQAARPAPPVAPANPSASAVSTAQINLTWQDNSSDETGFIIQRGTSSSGPWTQIATAGANAILYSNTGLSTATTYYYRVCAFNSRGNSSYSSVASASTICTYSISSTTAYPGTAAASGTLTVTGSPGGCNWTASSSAPSWLTCTPASGSFNGTVTWYVAANTSTSPRTGTLTIAGKTFTVSQAGAACTYSISPTGANPGSAAASGTLTVSGGTGCNWTASSSAAGWLTCTPASGIGTGTVTWFATANTSTSPRSGTLTIAGRTFTVTQTAAGCTYAISSASASFSSAGGNGNVGVTAGTGCGWNASSSVSWITTASSATGSGTAYYLVASNTGASSRTGTLTIADKTFTVTQAAAPTTCTYSISSTSASFTAAGGSSSVSVTAGSGCTWTASSSASWVTITAVITGSGNGTASYLVAANSSTSSRSAALTIAGRLFTVSQAAATSVSQATPGTLQWVKNMLCASGPASATGVAVDRAGNVAVSGTFAGTVDFGPGGPGPISSVGGSASSDGFVAKYNPQGGLLWVKSLGSTQGDYVQTIAVDGQDNIIVAGRFQGSVDFGGGALTSAGSSDIFVAKYAASGAHVWSKRFGGAGSDIVEQGSTVAIDGSGNVVLAAKFQGTADFGGISLSSAGSDDAGLVKLAGNDGHRLWAKRFGGSNIDVLKAVTVDKFGDVLVTGYFFGSTDLGGGSVAAAGGVNDTDIFLAKYNGTDGSYRWGKRFGNTLGDNGSGITTDPNTGNIVFTGLFKGTVSFGGPAPLDSYNNGGVFLVGLDPSGAYLWGKATGSGSTIDLGLAVRVDASGNLAVTGKSSSGIYFGGSQMLLGNGQPNLFVASFRINPLLPNAEPAYRWAKVVGEGTSGASQGNGVAFDASGRVLIAGSFLATIDFGGTSATALGGYGAGFVTGYGQ